MIKSEPQQFYNSYWFLWTLLSLKKTLLVIFKILRPFVHTFTAHDKHSVLNRQYLPDSIKMQLSQKQKKFSEIFTAFSKSRLNFEHIQKTRWHSELMYFSNYGFPKTWSDKYQKSIASEYPWTSKMVNGPKHCSNLKSGTFIIIIDHSEGNLVWKSQS